MSEYFIAVPKFLNLEQRLSKFPPNFKFSKDFCYYYIAEIIRESMKKHTSQNTKIESVINQFIPRSSVIMQSISRQSKRHIDYLYEDFFGEGRLLHRKNYGPGECYSYRLPEYFWGDGELEIIKISEHTLVKNIKKKKKPTIHNTVKKRFNFVCGYFSPKAFEIDDQEALKDLYTEYKVSGNYKQYLSNVLKVVDFKNSHFPFYHRPNTDGRLHTAITSFPKICRKYLKYGNEPLAEVDLSASIPFFLSYILNLTIKESQPYNILHNQIYNKNILSLYMLVKSSVSLSSKEVEDFKALVLNDTIYDNFMDKFLNAPNFEFYFESKFGNVFDGDVSDLRKYSKSRFLSMLFAKNNQFQWEQETLYEQFPTIHEFIKVFKQLKLKNTKSTDRHKRLSYLLFQLESHFMLNIVAREINNKFKRKIPLFSLHDCIITKKSDIDIISEQVHDIFIREIGYAPNLKMKVWE
ncbi:hypothetical protein [Epilithonimonas hispanica]|uniref:DNA-directed RNA polymerase n=1 Tax=Epilithonimonas hispanica TaxID=358687 RepID=A0A3D9CIB9_9FLAO|nr:hypothetical protein [Epilithonimonas hispanica]REC65523.1 hypothetical protein DRF58_17835 [Epilithonimonas hispanica]